MYFCKVKKKCTSVVVLVDGEQPVHVSVWVRHDVDVRVARLSEIAILHQKWRIPRTEQDLTTTQTTSSYEIPFAPYFSTSASANLIDALCPDGAEAEVGEQSGDQRARRRRERDTHV